MFRKYCIVAVLALLMSMPGVASAEEVESIGFWDVLPETILRPVGFLSFLGGCALFAATTPFTAIASIEAPHDAWFNSFNGFVGAPVRYTFTRPVGDYRFAVFPE